MHFSIVFSNKCFHFIKRYLVFVTSRNFHIVYFVLLISLPYNLGWLYQRVYINWHTAFYYLFHHLHQTRHWLPTFNKLFIHQITCIHLLLWNQSIPLFCQNWSLSPSLPKSSLSSICIYFRLSFKVFQNTIMKLCHFHHHRFLLQLSQLIFSHFTLTPHFLYWPLNKFSSPLFSYYFFISSLLVFYLRTSSFFCTRSLLKFPKAFRMSKFYTHLILPTTYIEYCHLSH